MLMIHLKKTMFKRWKDPGNQMIKTMKMHLVNCHFPKFPTAPKICSLTSWMASSSSSSDSLLISLTSMLTFFPFKVSDILEKSRNGKQSHSKKKKLFWWKQTRLKSLLKSVIMPHTSQVWMKKFLFDNWETTNNKKKMEKNIKKRLKK